LAVQGSSPNRQTPKEIGVNPGGEKIIPLPPGKIKGGRLNMVQVELEAKVKSLKEYKLLAEDLDSQIKALEDEIKAEMEARAIDEMVAGPFKVRWTKVMSQRFDTTAFRKAHESIYNLFTKTTESRRFSVA
jgi:predicted phage-related endonuclease